LCAAGVPTDGELAMMHYWSETTKRSKTNAALLLLYCCFFCIFFLTAFATRSNSVKYSKKTRRDLADVRKSRAAAKLAMQQRLRTSGLANLSCC
jgi:hypothetical protein